MFYTVSPTNSLNKVGLTLICQQYKPVLCEEDEEWIREDLALIEDVFEDVISPLHQVSDLGALRRPVYAPHHLLLHLLPEHILKKNRKHCIIPEHDLKQQETL